jgi:sporulation protein YlmC with PRC-barrel domain
MTDTPQEPPGTEEPFVLEKLGELQNQSEYLAHYPDVRGRMVVNPRGDEVGVVEDLYVNPHKRQVEMAAIAFREAAGYGERHVLVPVGELEILDGEVRILTKNERIKAAPEFFEGAPNYEPYYEYWSSQAVDSAEEPSQGFVRPPGRLELEDEHKKKEERPAA